MIFCTDCKFHSPAMAGSNYDRCRNPKCVDSDEDRCVGVRAGANPRCVHARGFLTYSERGSITVTCGKNAKFFEAERDAAGGSDGKA